MPPRKAISKKAAEKKEAPKQEAPVQAPVHSQSAGREAALREKAIGLLHPEAPAWLKDNLGLDVNNPRQIDTNTLYDIVQGKVTKPLDIVVTPLSYDREAKANVEMPRIKVSTSLKLEFPRKGKDFLPLDENNRVRMSNVPPLPYALKAEGYETRREAPQAPQEGAAEGERKNPEFNESQIRALEGVGINRDRLFGGVNYLNREEKERILSGEKFQVNGAVNTSAGLVRIIGEAKLSTDSEGKAVARFQSVYPEERAANMVIDLMSARRQELLTKNGRTVVEFDFFKRDSRNHVISDVNGRPLLNKAGENLVRYGMAMEPVTGFVQVQSWKDGKREVKPDPHQYQVSVVNGNLHFSEMRQVPDLNPDGTKVTYTDKAGKVHEQTHPEVYNAHVKDGKVQLDGKAYDFKSKADEENYLRGKPAVVKGFTYHDYKANKDVVYDAVVVADNRSAGFGKPFTPQTSQDLIKKIEKKETARKTQSFGMSI